MKLSNNWSGVGVVWAWLGPEYCDGGKHWGFKERPLVNELCFQTRPTLLVVLDLDDSPFLMKIMNFSLEKSLINSLMHLVKTKQVERTLTSNLDSVSE